VRIAAVGWALAVSACGGGAGPVDPGPGPAVWSGPLPTAAQLLPPGRYDCTASGPFVAPERPHPADCFRDPSCASRLVVGHRMATPFAPENSLAALRAAILLGVDVVETDVRMTADGHVVLLHDGAVDRTTTGTGSVSRYTLEALEALRLTDAPTPGDFSCETVPTLEEALSAAAGQIVVELEVKDTAAGVAAARYLKAHDLYGQAFLLCGASECRAIREAVPDAPIMSRPQAPEEVEAEVAYDPPPILVHIDPTAAFTAPAVLAKIHGVGAKVYANGFVLGDAPAGLGDDLGGYAEVYAQGVEVMQVENPHWALLAAGRLEVPR
jgi:glycerophosphoryl diester phosphodiesterase